MLFKAAFDVSGGHSGRLEYMKEEIFGLQSEKNLELEQKMLGFLLLKTAFYTSRGNFLGKNFLKKLINI